MSPPSTSRRAFLAACASGVLAGLAGCASVRAEFDRRVGPHAHWRDADLSGDAGPWPTLGHDARRTGYRPDAPTFDAETPIRTTTTAGSIYHVPPLVTDDLVYENREGHVEDGDKWTWRSGIVASDVETNETRWRLSDHHQVTAPTVVGNTLFVVQNRRLFALDRHTGDRYWRRKVENVDLAGAPAVVGDRLYVAGDSLWALDARTGEKRWTAELGVGARGVAATEGGVYVSVSKSDTEGSLLAFDADDGTERWVNAIGPNLASPVVGEEHVFVPSFDGLAAIARDGGSVTWQRSLDGKSYSSPPVFADGVVYVVGTSDDYLRAIDAESGDERWTSPLNAGYGNRTPYIGGDVVYGVSPEPNRAVFALDAETGTERWRREIDFDPATGPVLGDDALFVGES